VFYKASAKTAVATRPALARCTIRIGGTGVIVVNADILCITVFPTRTPFIRSACNTSLAGIIITMIPHRTVIVKDARRLADVVGMTVFPGWTIGVNRNAKRVSTTNVVDAFVAGGTFSAVIAVVSSLMDGILDIGVTVFIAGTADG